jgi:serine O-acetyltransferase
MDAHHPRSEDAVTKPLLLDDAIELARAELGEEPSLKAALKIAMTLDSYAILATTRARQAARRWHVPGAGRLLRLAQMALYGIEIGKDVELGRGVYFVHSLGIVIGGTAKIGDRVKFLGNNTVGTARNDGYPIIEDDVLVGCGARVLGAIRVGARSVIGANAVVLSDVPPDSLAVGVPAVVRPKPGGRRIDAIDSLEPQR